jgi:outer membrane biosynthesis protein TonB
MWPWQHKNIHKKQIMWAQLVGASFGAHVLFLFLFFFLYVDRNHSLLLTMSSHLLNQDLSILLMESYRKAPGKKGNAGASKSNLNAQLAAQVQTPEGHTAQSEVKSSVQKKVPSAKEVAVKTSLAPSKKMLREKKRKEAAAKKKAAALAKKKEMAAAKKAADRAARAQKKLEEKMARQAARDAKKAAAAQQELAAKELLPMPMNAIDQLSAVDSVAQGPIAIDGHEYSTQDLLEYAALQQEFARCWKPPVGMQSDCFCEITVLVGKNGTVEDMQMVRSSGVLMFDVAARGALSIMEFPRWVCSKSLTITFK